MLPIIVPFDKEVAINGVFAITITSPNVIFLSSIDRVLAFNVVVNPLIVKLPDTVTLSPSQMS